ncbi:MAG TPA: HEAT repeat domain-containing protein, partial [Anaeromyxobacteraceae bacterium]|nr:HEAT repeat domain-containing protein [Anaeromyxobacteraceae bacterium]
MLLGRLLDLMQATPETTTDHRSAMHALVELCAQRSATVRLRDGRLAVEAVDIPDDTPFSATLRRQLAGHGLAGLHLSHGASAVDLVRLLRLLAARPAGAAPGPDLEQALRRDQITSVAVVTAEADSAARERLDVRVSEALRATEGVEPLQTTERQARAAASGPIEVVPAARGAAFEEMARQQRAQGNTLVATVGRLQEEGDPHSLLGKLDAVQAAIARAVTGNELNQAFEAILKLIRQETEQATPEAQRAYGITLRRILLNDTLKRFMPYVRDDVYHQDVVTVLRRAGTQGTKILLDSLIEAPSQAERRAYLRALRQMETGSEVVASLLSHHQWYVVRNAADLIGELKVTEATAALGRVAQHGDARVRRSVGIALARLGTPDTAIHLRKVITDADREVRLAVAREIGGRNLSGLAMPLVSAADAEPDPEVQAEFYRALGRIGTPDA